MVERQRGRVINLTSHAGLHRWPLVSGYSVSKAAVAKLTENLAHETSRYGISIFSVHPGLLPIGMGERVLNTGTTTPYEEAIRSWTATELREGRGRIRRTPSNSFCASRPARVTDSRDDTCRCTTTSTSYSPTRPTSAGGTSTFCDPNASPGRSAALVPGRALAPVAAPIGPVDGLATRGPTASAVGPETPGGQVSPRPSGRRSYYWGRSTDVWQQALGATGEFGARPARRTRPRGPRGDRQRRSALGAGHGHVEHGRVAGTAGARIGPNIMNDRLPGQLLPVPPPRGV